LAGMVKSNPGKSLNDVAIVNFYNMLNWKAERAAKTVVEVPAHFTSQTCSAGGHCEKANRKTQAVFECLKCNHNQNADWNAAINILRLRQAAEMSSPEKVSHKDVTYRNTESVSLESQTITVSV